MFHRSDILADVKILDLSRIFTGPFCSQLLSDLGAEVIKIEPPGGDDTRRWGPPFIDDETSSYFFSLNRNKKYLQLNFKDHGDYARLLDLVGWADVIIENYRPGVSQSLRVSFGDLKEVNQKLVYLSITGFGATGPYSKRSAYDIIAQSEAGLMSITGTQDQIAKVGVPIGDIAGGMYGAIGILAALRKVEQTGKAIHVETNLFGSLTSFLTYQQLNTHFTGTNVVPMGTAHPNIVPYQSFRVRDGWISIAIGNDKLWDRFCEVMELGHLNEDPKFVDNKSRVANREELSEIISNLFADSTKIELVDRLNSRGIPVGRVNSIEEVMHHPQINHQRLLANLTYHQQEIPVLITPLKFTDTEELEFFAPEKVGE